MARELYFHEDHLPEDERELRRQFLISVGAEPKDWVHYDLNDWENMCEFFDWARHRVSNEVLNAQVNWWRAERDKLKDKRKEQRLQNIKDAVANGTILDLSPNEISDAKLYARARAFAEMQRSFDTLVEVRDDPDAKTSDRRAAANDLIARAIGPAEVPNSIPFPTNQTSLVEALDAIREGLSTGACSESFAKTMVTVLGAQVQAQKVDDIVASRARTINSSAIPSWVQHGTVVTLPIKPWPPQSPATPEQSPHAPVA